MLCMWFHVWIEVWEGDGMSFNCFSIWAREFLQGVQLKCLQGVRWQRIQIEIVFVLIHPEVQLGTGAVQGVRRPGKSLRVVNLSEAFEKLLL